jgi:hypothetical protein
VDGPKDPGGSMTVGSQLMMLGVISILWGGLIALLLIALGKEKQKSQRETDQ